MALLSITNDAMFANAIPSWLIVLTALLYPPLLVKSFTAVIPNQPCCNHAGRDLLRHRVLTRDEESALDRLSPESSLNDRYLEDDQGNVHIPKSGISVSDEMEAAQKDRFVTEVVPIEDLMGAAQLVTTTTIMGSFEPVRYLVALSPPNGTIEMSTDANSSDTEMTAKEPPPTTKEQIAFAMVDIPPFSTSLATRIRSYLSSFNGRLKIILVTNRDSIHYDDAPAVFSSRRADLDLWLLAFPGLRIFAYRLDIPRDCRHAIAQVLDGYGPFALNESDEENLAANTTGLSFVESGRPLTYSEWDNDVAQDVLSGKISPDDTSTEYDLSQENNTDGRYTDAAIRQREEGRRVLAVYTPGYSFGSVSFIFPDMGVCCSGFTIPVEDSRFEDNEGTGSAGPSIDCRGYLSLSRERKRQMESAKALVKAYIDRFNIILPSRGDPLFLEEYVSDRSDLLLSIIQQYEKIGDIYEQLGIFTDNEDS